MLTNDRIAQDPRHAEASRYALLRRLTPTLRHHIVGEFQPLGMLTALMERRLQNEAPNLAGLRENCQSLGDLSRTAAQKCVDLMTWLAPRADCDVSLRFGVAECLDLLATSLRFRGFALESQLQGVEARVSSSALRSVLPTALIAMSDHCSEPADLVVRAQSLPQAVQLSIDARQSSRQTDNRASGDYRVLRWDDVMAVAQAESVQAVREGEQVRLIFPTLSPS